MAFIIHSDEIQATNDLIEKFKIEANGNLAEYLTDCLRTFDQYINRRETWYGRDIFKSGFQEIK